MVGQIGTSMMHSNHPIPTNHFQGSKLRSLCGQTSHEHDSNALLEELLLAPSVIISFSFSTCKRVRMRFFLRYMSDSSKSTLYNFD